MFIGMSVVPVITGHTRAVGGYWMRMALIWSLTGLFWGAATWLISEALYQQHLRKVERSKSGLENN